MALLQTFPVFRPNLENLGEERVVPRARPAKVVGFRSGADLAPVVAEILASRVVSVDAPPGAGKSVLLPIALSKKFDGRVVHVLPYDKMAAAQHRYVQSRSGKDGVHLLLSPEEDMPESGLVITSAGCVVAMWLQHGEAVFGKCVLIQDESHESGAASGYVRMLGPVLAGVVSYVAMTATSGPDRHRKYEPKGSLDELEYEASAFADPWSVEEDGAPWAVSGLEGHVLIVEDDKHRAQQLIQAYNYNGLRAFRLHSGLAVREFLGILDLLYDPTNPYLIALIADSSFRSAYTFPLSLIVDSGVVRRVVVGPTGRPISVSRPIYEFERVQTGARGGRLEGQLTRYFRPKAKPESVMCDLGQADVEALALLCRVAGYRPPRYVAGAAMASGKIPKDISAALRGAVPLPCLPVGELIAVDELKAVSLREFNPESLPVSVPSDRAPVPEPRQGTDEPVDISSALDVLRGLTSTPLGDDRLDIGVYYCSSGVVTEDTVCGALPEGGDSARRILLSDSSRTVHHGWSPYVRSVAVNAMLHTYNVDLVHMKALTRLLLRAKTAACGKDVRALRAWAVACTEKVAELGGRVEISLSLVHQLARGFCSIVPYPTLFAEEEVRLAESFSSDFDNIPVVAVAGVSSEVRRVREWVGQAVEVGDERRKLDDIGRGSGSSVRIKEVPPLLRYVTGYPKYLPVKRKKSSRGSSSSS